MTATQRRIREQAVVREKILAAARDLFVRHGFDAVSMRKIAEAIEYTPPVIYTHFRDKAALMLQLCREDFGSLARKTARLRAEPDPVARMFRAGQVYIRFALEHPNHYRLMFMTPPPPGVQPEAQDLANMGNPDEDGYAFMVEAASQAIEAGRLRPEYRDPHLVAQLLWAGVHGLASLQITHKHDPWVSWRSVDKLTKSLCAGLLRGMLADPESLDAQAGATAPPSRKGGRR